MLKKISLVLKYGELFEDNWKIVLKEGINKLFEKLKPEGIFILKWCDNSKNVDEVLKLFPYKPMFGTKTGQKNHTHWILFIKCRMEKELEC
jgi:hypothetical protein